MLKPVIKWFHLVTSPSGKKRLKSTLKSRFCHPELRLESSKLKYDLCKRHKLFGKGYNLLPEKKLVFSISQR